MKKVNLEAGGRGRKTLPSVRPSGRLALRRRAQGGVFSMAHTAKAKREGSVGEEESYPSSQKAAVASIHHGRAGLAGDRYIATTSELEPEEELKERLLCWCESERKWVFLCRRRVRTSEPAIDILPSRPRTHVFSYRVRR